MNLLSTMMKFLSALVIVLYSGSSTASDIDSVERALKSTRDPISPLSLAHHHQYLNGRHLSDDCVDSTGEIYNTAEIQSANDAWIAEFSADTFQPECVPSDNGDAGTCTYDARKLTAQETFLSSCAEVGGSPQTFSDSFDCIVTDSGKSIQLTIAIVDVPECIATSCDGYIGQALASELVSQSKASTEAQLASQFDQVECMDGPSSLAHGMVPAKASISLGCLAHA